MIIDAHCQIGKGRFYDVSSKDLIKEMRICRIEKAFICPGETEIASDCNSANEKMANIKKDFPDKSRAWAVANPWTGKNAVKTLKTAKQLGLDGLKLHPKVQGYNLSDRMLYPLIEFALDVNWPIYADTGTPICSEPMQLVELAEKFPKAKFIMGHIAFADFWYDVVEAMKRSDNIWAETSHHGSGMLKAVVSEISSDKLIFGSDFPIGNIEVELGKVKNLDLFDKDLEKVLFHNIEGLMDK
ncbi:amidohydrolase family protein [bacterium]|nr:amidohydrolase family protein [bacterium]